MAPLVLKTPRAKRDLRQHYLYIRKRNRKASTRFLEAAEEALLLLARVPLMGRLWESPSPRLAGVRFWTIPTFKNYRIFYRPIDGGIEFLHLFHARRDIQQILDDEDKEADDD
jgi:toxin ParE1/3/4